MTYQDTEPKSYMLGDVRIRIQCYSEESIRGWSYKLDGFVQGIRSIEWHGYASEEDAIQEAKRTILSQIQALKKSYHDQVCQLGRLEGLVFDGKTDKET
jgi:hypothetical protein